ncbi:aspartate aminotransferase family protein [Nakamurella endophytica]|uniref:Aminotransferase n=1 Tax=Nakamurella endophytica TaxID=1748367 RepID=A0A917WCT2_9ACTN|nr:aspartate aminotransferase family protein [Nakamurella endophytica]GGL93514.1 putative aminotransferase [Nakamurella endophytica]
MTAQLTETGDGHPGPEVAGAVPRGLPDDIAAVLRRPPVTAPVTDPDADAATRADDRGHVFHSWSAQSRIDPVPVAGGLGVRFFDDAGRSYLDFGSQLVNLNLGHGHPDLVAAIKTQADRLATIQPSFASDVRGTLARLIVERAGAGFSHVFFTNGGTEANEHALRMARLHTGRHKVLSTYRSYHGATAGSITLTGEPRRWGSEPGIPGVVHFSGPYPYRSPFHATSPEQETERALAHLSDVVTFEGPHTVAAIVLETVVGTNGVLVPPPGYLEGVRELCDRWGILLVADEVMVGFGRLGSWFGIQRFGATPDLITFAKGVNSGYVPLGGVVIPPAVVETFAERAYPGGLTYSGHPLACAAGVASIGVIERDDVLGHVRRLETEVFAPELTALADRHPVVGEVRGLGAFWAIELVRDRETRTPLVPFNAAGADLAPMLEIGAACRARGVWPFLAGNRIHVAPPLISTADEIREGLAAIDAALSEADAKL